MSLPLIRPFKAADRDWLVNRHTEYYADQHGFDASFGELVGDIVDAFMKNHDSTRECGWICHSEDRRLGSIFCVRLNDKIAKLRLFYLEPDMRGHGLGKKLLAECMGFAEAKGYAGMQLWTHESHREACALYKATGWTMAGTKPVTSFGQKLVEQEWSYCF